MMHFAMVTETYPPEVNGVARTVALMADGLLELGHTIQLVRPRQDAADTPFQKDGYQEFLCKGVPIPRYTSLRMGLPAKSALLRAWKERRPDVVHIATEGPLGWSALAAARALSLPVASDFHTNFHAYSRHYGAAWLARPVAAVLRRFHNRCDCTMVPTAEMADDLTQLGFERLRVVGRGVDSTIFSPVRRRRELRAEWGADDETLVAICVSRFAREKDFPFVIEVYDAMRRARPGTQLVLVGHGPMEAELRSAGVGHVIGGRREDTELSALYASGDVFLYPSLTETFGNVTLEAMASGLAVVAYRTAAARQFIDHGCSGLLAEPGDRAGFVTLALQLASDPRLVRDLGRAARTTAETVGWEGISRDFEAVLAECVALPRGRH
jgi:glycosyltransferase involved in cell wall biosynthesis